MELCEALDNCFPQCFEQSDTNIITNNHYNMYQFIVFDYILLLRYLCLVLLR